MKDYVDDYKEEDLPGYRELKFEEHCEDSLVDCRCGNSPYINDKGQVYCEDCELVLGKGGRSVNIGIAADRWNEIMSDEKVKSVFGDDTD